MTSPLANVRHFAIARSVLVDSLAYLSKAGADGYEAFVVWGAVLENGGARATMRTVIAPSQTAHRTPDGLLVTVEGRALFEINRTLYERGEILAAQMHSHPRDAYHSTTDDHFPLVTLDGALSVVVPNFALNAPGDIDEWAWYRLVRAGDWEPLSSTDAVEVL